MSDHSLIPHVADVMVRRIADRLSPVTGDEPRALEERLSSLDGWTLETLLRVTSDRDDAGPPRRRTSHLGVRGVDHALNRLVVDDPRRAPEARELEAIDLSALDDEDLIAAARYVPETLPGYLLG